MRFVESLEIIMKKKIMIFVLSVLIMVNPLPIYPKQQISVSTNSLDFAKVSRGSHKSLEFSINTKTLVTLKTDKLWIELDSTNLKTKSRVKVTIKGSLLPLGINHFGAIILTAQGYDPTTIKVQVTTEKNIELKMKIDSKTATLNGKTIEVKTPMRMKGCTPLVPLRFVSNIFEATTFFNPKDSTIKITRLDRTIEILPDVEEYLVNGKKKISNPAPRTYDGVMFVPLGFISSAFGICVDWDRTGKQGMIKLCD